jgi:hypothetical protein
MTLFILNSADETISQEKSELRGRGGEWRGTMVRGSDETVVAVQVPGRSEGGGGEQGAEKEDKPPATAADKLRGH